MNNAPDRAPPSTPEPEEATPDFGSPGSWSLPRKLSAVALANVLAAFFYRNRFGGELGLGERLVMFAIVTLAMSSVLVLRPVLERWRALRNARAVARLMGEDR
jgi:hypothetical protein